MPFTYHTDPAHGWLEVSLTDLALTGMELTNFSRYSYRNATAVFLEEDCDMPRFLSKWEGRNECRAELVERYAHNSFVRNLPRINA